MSSHSEIDMVETGYTRPSNNTPAISCSEAVDKHLVASRKGSSGSFSNMQLPELSAKVQLAAEYYDAGRTLPGPCWHRWWHYAEWTGCQSPNPGHLNWLSGESAWPAVLRSACATFPCGTAATRVWTPG